MEKTAVVIFESSVVSIAVLAAALCFSAPANAAVSVLWGLDGDRWSAASRLPDFSYAGYHAGEKDIPDVPVKANVKDFGATGDGNADDTAAFLKAIAATEHGALLIPAGRYKITQRLNVTKSGVVLRGQGEDKTVLYFPLPLTDMVGKGKKFASGGSWSWSGGVISFTGRDRGGMLTRVSAPALRGDRSLKVASPSAVMPGQWVRIVLTDTDGSLAKHLHAERADGPKAYFGRQLVDFSSRVDSVENGVIVLQRPLRTDVRPEWKPAVYGVAPSVEEAGIEHLAIEFPPEKYVGHHIEPGYNALSFEGVRNCWARDLRITNADSGIFFRERTKFCTARTLRFTAAHERLRIGYGADTGEPRTMQVGGHHGLLMDGWSQDNLVSGFQFDLRFIHDTGVSAWAAGNVFSGGRGIDIDFDHHRRAPYENLFTDIEAGEGSRMWQGGGDESDGPHAGARETFWNIRAARPQRLPEWAIEGNFIGVASTEAVKTSPDGNWWEPVAPGQLKPADLFFAQKARRMAR